jgi:hypothetical protein
VYSKRMQFEAGPEQTTFYACEDCVEYLFKGQVTDFFDIGAPLEVIIGDVDEPCSFCPKGQDDLNDTY